MNRQAKRHFLATCQGHRWAFKSSGLRKAWGRAIAWALSLGLDKTQLEVEDITPTPID